MDTKTELKTILVIDDESDVRTYLGRLFQESGYSCAFACDGVEAMQRTRVVHPHLITLDMSMSNKSGVKFYRELKADPELRAIPVVVVTGVTGQGGSDDTRRFLETRKQVPPPDAFVPKPVNRAELLDIVAALI